LIASVTVNAPPGDPTRLWFTTFGPFGPTVHPVAVKVLQAVLVSVIVTAPWIETPDGPFAVVTSGCPSGRLCARPRVEHRQTRTRRKGLNIRI
jgi:hypothetical protein